MEDLKLALTNEQDHNTEHKDRLCGVVAAGNSRKHLGKEYTVKHIEALDSKELDKLYHQYETKFGNEIVQTVGKYTLSLFSRVLSVVTPVQVLGYNVTIDSEDELTNDLSSDPIISASMAGMLSNESDQD